MKERSINKIIFLLKNKFIILCLFIFLVFIIQKIFYSEFLPSNETKDLWFYSGIFMVLFSVLFIEPYYTSPKNVLTNVIPLFFCFITNKVNFCGS